MEDQIKNIEFNEFPFCLCEICGLRVTNKHNKFMKVETNMQDLNKTTSLNDLIKMQHQSRRSGNSVLIPQKAKRRSCPSCNRQKLVASKINEKFSKLLKP